MARSLNVYWERRLVGSLTQDDNGRLGFAYAESWLRGKNATAISQSLPLRPEPYDDRASEPFFAGLLPEADARAAIARNLGVSPRNDFALLEIVGGDCAGALMLLAPDEPLPEKSDAPQYRVLQGAELLRVIRDLPRKPLMAGEEGVRLSLAGAQNKLPVYITREAIALPLGETASTHILKPPIDRYDGIAENEIFCLSLASACGIDAARAELQRVDRLPFLLIRRYDRDKRGGKVVRLHQEDFCQALGVSPENKYQAEGGPGLVQSVQLIRSVSINPVEDIRRLIEAVVFNLVIGNNDAHGKNFAILYGRKGPRLAPLYDLVSTAVYPELSNRLAMNIGGKNRLDDIMPRHFDKFCKEAGLNSNAVRRLWFTRTAGMDLHARRVAARMTREGNYHPVLDRILELIAQRSAILLKRFTN